jgi:hypothetical protein
VREDDRIALFAQSVDFREQVEARIDGGGHGAKIMGNKDACAKPHAIVGDFVMGRVRGRRMGS